MANLLIFRREEAGIFMSLMRSVRSMIRTTMLFTTRTGVLVLVAVPVLLSLTVDSRGVPAQTSSESKRQTWQKTFDVVWKTVNEKYVDATFGGVDWVEVRRRYTPQLATVQTDGELRDLLTRMLGEIRISHLRILDLATLEKQLGRAVVNRGLALRNIENQIVVTRIVEGSPAALAGLRPGFVVQAIDDAAVTNARDAEATLATDTDKHRLAILDEADRKRELTIEYALPPVGNLESVKILNGTRAVFVEARELGDKIGYIHFTNFIEPMKKRLPAAFDFLRSTRGLIIDLRGNSGGDTEVGLAMAGLLVGKETTISITRTRNGDNNSYKAKPQKNAYSRPVVILLDEESASESEEVAAGLQAAGRVFVIGKKSRGEDMDATFQQLPMDSIALLYPVGLPRTTKGVVVEGHGVEPDLEVSLTRADLLKGRDAQLEAAMRHIAESAQRR
jgi:C-terminal peptidase prc